MLNLFLIFSIPAGLAQDINPLGNKGDMKCINSPQAPKEASIDSRCLYKLDVGLCRGAFKAAYFDWGSGTCKEGTYGGCGGCKPFDSISECESACSSQSPKKRKCKRRIPHVVDSVY